jgi:hypothetical protein
MIRGFVQRLVKRLAHSVAALAALAVLIPMVTIAISELSVTPAGAENSAESHCISLIGGSGTYGSNSSTTAACERLVSDTIIGSHQTQKWNVGGVNLGTTFGGHIEFFYYGAHTTLFRTGSWGSHAATVTLSTLPLCPTGTVTTILWKHTYGTHYTNMGEAVETFRCAAPNQLTPSNIQISVTPLT